MYKSFILNSISNGRSFIPIFKRYSSKSSPDLIKCHFHLESKLGGYPYKIIKKLPSNIEIREYEESIWCFDQTNFNKIVGKNHEIPLNVCTQRLFKFQDRKDLCIIKNNAKENRVSIAAVVNLCNDNNLKAGIKNKVYKVIPRMTVAAAAAVGYNVVWDKEVVLNDRKKIIQELENENEIEKYDLENLFTAEFYNQFLLIPYFKSFWYNEIWLHKIRE